MRTILIAAGAGILLSAGSPAQLNPLSGTVLPPGAGKEALNQCSRAAPGNVRAIWQPPREQIAALERLLPRALSAVTSTFRVPYHPRTDYRRQYVGIVSGKRKLIYVNAFPAESGERAADGPPAARTFDWRRQAVVVCDGGPAFFGAEYDPASESFDHFEFNGSP